MKNLCWKKQQNHSKLGRSGLLNVSQDIRVLHLLVTSINGKKDICIIKIKVLISCELLWCVNIKRIFCKQFSDGNNVLDLCNFKFKLLTMISFRLPKLIWIVKLLSSLQLFRVRSNVKGRLNCCVLVMQYKYLTPEHKRTG